MQTKTGAIVGVSDHSGWAVLVTATSDGTLLDRRRVELVDEGLPKMPYHHDAQGLPLDEATRMIEGVRASAESQAGLALDAVASTLPECRLGVALRVCQPLPGTIALRLKDYRAQNTADWVMYRMAIALAATTRGWAVHWYDAKRILQAGARALGLDDLDAHFQEVRTAIGPPWNNDHKLAMAAAIVAAQAELWV